MIKESPRNERYKSIYSNVDLQASCLHATVLPSYLLQLTAQSSADVVHSSFMHLHSFSTNDRNSLTCHRHHRTQLPSRPQSHAASHHRKKQASFLLLPSLTIAYRHSKDHAYKQHRLWSKSIKSLTAESCQTGGLDLAEIVSEPNFVVRSFGLFRMCLRVSLRRGDDVCGIWLLWFSERGEEKGGWLSSAPS